MRRSNVLGLGGIISIPEFYQFIHYINCMVIQNYNPTLWNPILVQVNYSDGDIGFYLAENYKGVLEYTNTKIVAIFKCKPKP